MFASITYRHQDLHNRAFSMVVASNRWLGFRADVLCAVLTTAVAFASVLASQNPGINHENSTELIILTKFIY